MTSPVTIRLAEAKNTHLTGVSLASSLYAFPVDILLSGELGAGKTTFMQGFAEGLGIKDRLVSPTYALEQRYQTALQVPLIHIDVYRLNATQAQGVLAATDEHEGIRCIEWASRVDALVPGKRILLDFAEIGSGRSLTVTFNDMDIPSDETVRAWQAQMQLPRNIIAHCDEVARVAEACAKDLLKRGRIIRIDAVRAAAHVHDLFRFLDFKPGGAPDDVVIDFGAEKLWSEIRAEYPGMRHEAACTAFLERQRYPELGRIVLTHGVMTAPSRNATIEQRILYYADKRVRNDAVVSVDERFEDFVRRYGEGKVSAQAKAWCDEAKRIESDLFPEGAPV